MSAIPDSSLLKKVATELRRPPAYASSTAKASILSIAATSYGWQSTGEEVTQPTGFDPEAARLFKAVVEAAFLVASADGEFDQTERSAFCHVVVSACHGSVMERQVTALLADLTDQSAEGGLEERIRRLSKNTSRKAQARGVLRVAALLDLVVGGRELTRTPGMGPAGARPRRVAACRARCRRRSPERHPRLIIRLVRSRFS